MGDPPDTNGNRSTQHASEQATGEPRILSNDATSSNANAYDVPTNTHGPATYADEPTVPNDAATSTSDANDSWRYPKSDCCTSTADVCFDTDELVVDLGPIASKPTGIDIFRIDSNATTCTRFRADIDARCIQLQGADSES